MRRRWDEKYIVLPQSNRKLMYTYGYTHHTCSYIHDTSVYIVNTYKIDTNTYRYSYHRNVFLAKWDGMHSLLAMPITVADVDI